MQNLQELSQGIALKMSLPWYLHCSLWLTWNPQVDEH